MWRRHSCLQRRDSSRRRGALAPRSTIDNPRLSVPAPLLRDYPRCNSRSDSIPVHLAPSGRRTRPARTSLLCGPELDSPAGPSLLSGIAAVATVRFSATEVHAHGLTGPRRLPDHSDPVRPPAGETQRSGARSALEPGTSARGERCRGGDPSRQRRRRRKAWRQEDTSHEGGCHEDARSQRATVLRDTDGEAGVGILAYLLLVRGRLPESRRMCWRERKSAETSPGAADTSVCATSRSRPEAET